MALGTGPTVTLATSPRRTTLPAGVSMGSSLTAVNAGARLRGAPDDRVVRLAVAEDVTHFLAGDEGRCRPSDVAGFQPVLRRLGQVDLNLYLGLIERNVDVIVDDALDSGELVLQLEALAPQDGQVLAV